MSRREERSSSFARRELFARKAFAKHGKEHDVVLLLEGRRDVYLCRGKADYGVVANSAEKGGFQKKKKKKEKKNQVFG